MKVLDAWDWLINTRIAAVADVFALLLVLPWAGCLVFNADLLQTIAPLAAIGSRAPRLFWALVAVGASGLEIYGLILRAAGGNARTHRLARLWASLVMAVFLGGIGGELMRRDVGVPGAWYFPEVAVLAILGFGRLLQLVKNEDTEKSRL